MGLIQTDSVVDQGLFFVGDGTGTAYGMFECDKKGFSNSSRAVLQEYMNDIISSQPGSSVFPPSLRVLSLLLPSFL
jgi:hypothetical protein